MFSSEFCQENFDVDFVSSSSFIISKSRSCVQRFDSFKANEVEPNVTNSGLARLCGSFRKYILSENFGEKCLEN